MVQMLSKCKLVLSGCTKIYEFREFINCCWSSKPEDRWSMDHIVELIRNHKLILPNCNNDELNQYIQELDDSLK